MALQGTLNYLDIAHLLQVVGTSRKSGVLEITFEDQKARLFFNRGRLIRAESNRFHEGIGTLLVEAGMLTSEDRDRALASQRAEGGVRRLGALLCDEYGIRPEDIERILRQQYEKIVYDTFSWPGGTFVFAFQDPEAVMDRFNLNPSEFILGVGIQAGLLAEAGVARERGGESKPSLVLLSHDHEVVERCCGRWKRKGHSVFCMEEADEILERLDEWGQGGGPLVLVADFVHPTSGDRGLLGGFELLKRIQSLRPEIPVVVVGDSADPKVGVATRARGAYGYVKKPPAEDLRGPHGDVHMDVFLMTLEKAIEMATAAPGKAQEAASAPNRRSV